MSDSMGRRSPTPPSRPALERRSGQPIAAGILSLILAVLLVGWTESGRCCEIRVRVPEGNSYVPFTIKDASGKWSGLSIELTEALFQEAGCTPVYKALPFARGLYSLQIGEIDMMPNMTITRQRKVFMHFIGPQVDETVFFVTRKNARYAIASIDDFRNLPLAIGVDRGKVYGSEFEQKRAVDPLFRSRLEEVNDVDLNEKKLAMGRISGFLGYDYNVMYQMKTNPLYNDFAIHPFVVHRDWVYFGFSKKSVSPELLARLQEAYDQATRQGVFEAIRRKYTFVPPSAGR
jgi:polar amino acid transport system substrate-binding protein